MPVTQTVPSSTTAPANAPSLTSAYSNAPVKQRLHKARTFIAKWKWVLLAVAVGIFAMFYMRQGRNLMCKNLGVACDTRPLPGGVKGV